MAALALNRSRHRFPGAAAWLLAASLLGPVAFAAVPVEDMSLQPGDSDPPTGGSGARGGQLRQLFFDLQQLQQEVAQLRGQIEDQGLELNRLRQLQRQQYLDVDRRLSALAVAPAPAAARPAPPAAQTSAPARSTGQVASAPAAVPSANERGAYAAAFELMKSQQFAASISAFQNLLETHPNGEYAPNAYYWLGELYLIEQRLEDARVSFQTVVENYPAHQKVPDSLYKLGVAHHRLGQADDALTFFDDVVNRYPDTPAAGLARTYAAELR